MSVTISFTSLLFYAAVVGAAQAIGTVSATRRQLPEELLNPNSHRSEEINAILFPNLAEAKNAQKNEQVRESFVRRTLAQHPELLRCAVEALGGRHVPLEGTEAFELRGVAVVPYRATPESEYELWLVGNLDEKTASALADAIETEYVRLVREQVHTALLERSSEFGLSLESEEVRPDQSVVLTFTV